MKERVRHSGRVERMRERESEKRKERMNLREKELWICKHWTLRKKFKSTKLELKILHLRRTSISKICSTRKSNRVALKERADPINKFYFLDIKIFRIRLASLCSKLLTEYKYWHLCRFGSSVRALSIFSLNDNNGDFSVADGVNTFCYYQL